MVILEEWSHSSISRHQHRLDRIRRMSLIRARKEAGMTQIELSKKTGINLLIRGRTAAARQMLQDGSGIPDAAGMAEYENLSACNEDPSHGQ